MNAETKKLNMLTGSLWDKVFLFALPLAATGILQQLFNAADIAVVGRFTGDMGSIAMAAVGTNSPIVNLIVNLFVGLGMGTNVVIATAVGMKDSETIHKAVHSSILFAVIAGVGAAILGELLATPVLRLIQVPEEVMPLAELYLRIYVLGFPVILLYNYESAIFRAMGDTKTPLIALALSGIINVGLNFLFVVGLGMTVEGVATATVISNLISASLLFGRLSHSKLEIRVSFKKLRIDKKVFLRIMKIGVPAGIQSAVFAFANIVVQSAVNTLETVVMAASSAAFNVEIFAFYVLNSFGQACTTFVGQNNGARQVVRCKKTLGLCIAECALCLGIAIAVILTFGKSILSIFNTDPAVIETGYVRLVFIFSSYGFSMLYDSMAGYLRGFGISLTPALLTTAGVCVVRILWIAFVFPLKPDFYTIMTVYPVSLVTTAILMAIAVLCVRPAKKRKLLYEAQSSGEV